MSSMHTAASSGNERKKRGSGVKRGRSRSLVDDEEEEIGEANAEVEENAGDDKEDDEEEGTGANAGME